MRVMVCSTNMYWGLSLAPWGCKGDSNRKEVCQLYSKIGLLPVWKCGSWALELDGPIAVSHSPHLSNGGSNSINFCSVGFHLRGFWPVAAIWPCRETFFGVSQFSDVGAFGIWWVESRDLANCPVMHSTAPINNYLDPNVNSAEKLCFVGLWRWNKIKNLPQLTVIPRKPSQRLHNQPLREWTPKGLLSVIIVKESLMLRVSCCPVQKWRQTLEIVYVTLCTDMNWQGFTRPVKTIISF